MVSHDLHHEGIIFMTIRLSVCLVVSRIMQILLVGSSSKKSEDRSWCILDPIKFSD